MAASSRKIEEWLDSLHQSEKLSDDEIDKHVVDLMTRYSSDEIATAVVSRLSLLPGHAGTLVVRLVEAVARPTVYEALADYLEKLPELSPALLLEAVDALEGTGCIETRPALQSLRDDLDAYFDEHAAIESLVSQIEDDPQAVDLILDGLWLMEAESRDEILESLEDFDDRASVRELLSQAEIRKVRDSLDGEA